MDSFGGIKKKGFTFSPFCVYKEYIFTPHLVEYVHISSTLKAGDEILHNNPLIGTKYEDSQIYQANPLIESCKNMDLNEGRLFYLGLMELKPQLLAEQEQQDFKTILVPTNEIIRLFGGHKDYYRRLKGIARRLMARTIGIKENEEEEEFHWINLFSTMEFDKKKGGLRIKFNIDMKPYVLQLADKPYTRIAAKTIFALSSMYAIRLIELMLQYQDAPSVKLSGVIERELSLQEIRKYLQVPENSYKEMRDFKRYVLDAPIRDINESTRYIFNYTPVKTGHRITSFRFSLEIPEEEDIKTVQELIAYKKESSQMKMTAADTETTDMVALLRSYGVGKIVARRLANEFPEETIRNNIRYALEQKRVKNLGQYIVKAIREDYFSARGMSFSNEEEKIEDLSKNVSAEEFKKLIEAVMASQSWSTELKEKLKEMQHTLLEKIKE